MTASFFLQIRTDISLSCPCEPAIGRVIAKHPLGGSNPSSNHTLILEMRGFAQYHPDERSEEGSRPAVNLSFFNHGCTQILFLYYR